MKSGIDYVGIFIAGICHDGNGNVLFRKRGEGARDEQGKWDPGVGGALDHSETIEQCLIRESQEEISTKPLSYEFLGMMEKFRILDGANTHWLGFYYKCLVDPQKVIIDGREADEMKWLPFSDYPKPMMIGFEDVYEKYKKYF